MGHERVGILPKTARWTRLVHQMGGVSASEVPVRLNGRPPERL